VVFLQVARRVRGADHVAKGMEPGGKKRAVRYQCGLGQEEVFLHPHSALYKAAPEFVIYSQLIRSAKRPYMAGTFLSSFRLAMNLTPYIFPEHIGFDFKDATWQILDSGAYQPGLTKALLAPKPM